MGVHALVIYCMKSLCVCAAKYIKNEFLTRERVIYRSRKNHGAAVVTNLGSVKYPSECLIWRPKKNKQKASL